MTPDAEHLKIVDDCKAILEHRDSPSPKILVEERSYGWTVSYGDGYKHFIGLEARSTVLPVGETPYKRAKTIQATLYDGEGDEMHSVEAVDGLSLACALYGMLLCCIHMSVQADKQAAQEYEDTKRQP